MSIIITKILSEQQEITSLPHTIYSNGSAVLGVFLTLFSLPFWGGAGFFLINILYKGTFEPGHLLLLIFVLVGIGVFLLGLSQFFSKQSCLLSINTIEFNSKGLFGKKTWSESTRNYEGIFSTTETRSTGGQNSSTYKVYVLRLHHTDKAKSILLYESRQEKPIRGLWEKYSQLFNLPCIEETEEGIIKRDTADLNKSIKQLAQEDKIDIDFSPGMRAPKGLSLDRRIDEWAISQNSIPVKSFMMIPLVAAFLSLFVYIGFWTDAPVIFGIFGIGILLLLMIHLIWCIITTQVCILNNKELRVFHKTPWGKTKGKNLPLNEIESINIKKRDVMNKYLEIVSDKKKISFTTGLSDQSLKWLKNCLLYRLTS